MKWRDNEGDQKGEEEDGEVEDVAEQVAEKRRKVEEREIRQRRGRGCMKEKERSEGGTKRKIKDRKELTEVRREAEE